MRHVLVRPESAEERLPRRSFLLLGATALAEGSTALAGREKAAQAKAPWPRFLMSWGKKGPKPGEFHFPIGIAVNPADVVFVTDYMNKRVQKFTAEGKFLSAFAVGESPGGLALDRHGNIHVVHLMLHKVTVHSPAGKLLREWGKKGVGNGELAQPGGIAIAANGQVFVADQENRRVQRFTADGKFLAAWGRYGTRPGEFGGNVHPRSRVGGPNFLALDGKGNLYATEGSVGRVQKFTDAGKFLLAWGDNENRPGSFGGVFTGFKDRKTTLQGPIGICTDKQRRVWVSAVCGRVQQFSEAGKFLRGFGEAGVEPGQFYAPHGLALDSRGHLFVVDAYNHRIQKFAV